MSEPFRDWIDRIFAEGTAIDRALNNAFYQAVARHRRAGVPLVAWREGKVVRIPPEEIPLPPEPPPAPAG